MLAQKITRPRSFVRRNSRKTAAQIRAHAALLPIYGLPTTTGIIDQRQVFNRSAPCHLEIGFGSGQSLLLAAKNYPEKDFIGIETHEPGIGSLLLGIEKNALSNLRIMYGDAIEILAHNIADTALTAVQIFFPDPWPKRRHHVRRLVQAEFVNCLCNKLKTGGVLHLATDWEDYALHIMKVLSQSILTNMAGVNCYASRSHFRPIVTKFERRAISAGRKIWDLQFIKNN